MTTTVPLASRVRLAELVDHRATATLSETALFLVVALLAPALGVIVIDAWLNRRS